VLCLVPQKPAWERDQGDNLIGGLPFINQIKDDVKVLAFTKDLPLLQTVIEGLTAEGGGLCPEVLVGWASVDLPTNSLPNGGQR